MGRAEDRAWYGGWAQIERKLAALEAEEEALVDDDAADETAYAAAEDERYTMPAMARSAAAMIRHQTAIKRVEAALRRSRSHPRTHAIQV